MTDIFHKMLDTSFRFSIDRGGTFTDVYAEVPGQPEFRVVKLLSEDPRIMPTHPERAFAASWSP